MRVSVHRSADVDHDGRGEVDRADRADHAGRVDHAARVDHTSRVDHDGRIDHDGRVDRADHAGSVEHGRVDASVGLVATRALVAPIALAAIALLVINDHALKAAAPGALTGKLSDVAGMVVFPLVLAAGAELIGVRRGCTAIAAAAIATGAVFAAIKLCAPAGDAYRVGLAALQWPVRAGWSIATGDALPALGRARLTMDPTDLIALPALALPLWLARRLEWRGDALRPRRDRVC